MRNFEAGLLAIVILVTSFVANAQVWLEGREETEGPGIKVSDSLVLHLGLGLEGGYDTNALYKNKDLEPAGRMRITPYVDLATRGKKRLMKNDGHVGISKQKVLFRLGLASFYDHYFAINESGKSAIENLNGKNGLGVDTHLKFILFPEGKFSLITDASYSRTLQPYESSGDAMAHHRVSPGIGFKIRPGGGTLSFEAGYRLHLLYYEDSSMSDVNNHAHDIRLITRWKIFPKTALLSKIRFTPTFYFDDGSLNESSYPIRSSFGIQGLVTDRFGLMLLAGYGASNYKNGPNFDSFIAKGEFMFFITPFSNVKLGGQRDFVDSLYANYYVKTGGYLSFQQMFGGLVLASLKGELFYRDYATFNGPMASGDTPSHTDRNDTWASATLAIEVRAADWLSFHVSGRYLTDITDFGYNRVDEGNPNDPNDDVSSTIDSAFGKFEFFAGVRAHY